MLEVKKIENYPYTSNNKFRSTPTDYIHYTSIVILTYNQLEYTRLCIESIRKFTPKGRYELIIVDNNSTDETVSWLNSQDDLKIIMNNKNYGVPKGYNQGIKAANGENILLLNNDVIVTPNWLHNLDLALWSDSKIGAVSCLSNYVSNAQRIDVNYDDITSMLDFSKEFNISDKSKYELRGRLIGFCLLIKKKVIDNIGLLDEQFYPGNYEDDDYCMRMLKEKYRLILCKDTFIHHFGSKSFKSNDFEYNEIIRINRAKFKKKWFKNYN